MIQALSLILILKFLIFAAQWLLGRSTGGHAATHAGSQDHSEAGCLRENDSDDDDGGVGVDVDFTVLPRTIRERGRASECVSACVRASVVRPSGWASVCARVS